MLAVPVPCGFDGACISASNANCSFPPPHSNFTISLHIMTSGWQCRSELNLDDARKLMQRVALKKETAVNLFHKQSRFPDNFGVSWPNIDRFSVFIQANLTQEAIWPNMSAIYQSTIY